MTSAIPHVGTIVEALQARARDRPDALAYSADGRPVTCGSLLKEARDLGGRLTAQGLARGGRCAVVLPTGLDFIRAVYATQLAGGIPVAVNAELPPAAVMRRLELVHAALAVGSAPVIAALRSHAGSPPCCPIVTLDELARGSGPSGPLALPDPADPAFLQLTSGTTGEPRAVIVSHRSLIASLRATARRLEMRQDDVLATWVPLHHDLGLVRYVFGAMLSGCPAHLIRPSIVNLQPWLELIARTRATITGAPDSAYRLAARTVRSDGLELQSLRFAGNGGETVRLTTIEQFERRFGLPGVVRPAYGLAEATLTVTSTGPGEELRVDATGMVSCGRPLDGIELRIVDVDGRDTPAGSSGELLVRGVPVFDGYFGDEAATRHTLRNGWLHTGDIATVDAQGFLFLRGRSRVLIKRAGATIAPREIEDAVDRVAEVNGSAAVGAPLSPGATTDDVVVVAEVRAGRSESESGMDAILSAIDQEVRKALGWAPGRILLVPAGTIPRTAAGKIRYDEVRDMVTGDVGTGHVLRIR